jgi:murein L,D-transpeptidase YafK
LYVLDAEGNAIARFPIICGRNSHLGTKEAEGDQRTPRGEYRICTINHESRFALFFGISYPAPHDARKALADGRIDKACYDEILEAYNNNRRPPWSTPLGGEVGIHGGGIDRDGTRGCIGMKDEDCMTLDKFVQIGTLVEIS